MLMLLRIVSSVTLLLSNLLLLGGAMQFPYCRTLRRGVYGVDPDRVFGVTGMGALESYDCQDLRTLQLRMVPCFRLPLM
jgi:hypothetical protein